MSRQIIDELAGILKQDDNRQFYLCKVQNKERQAINRTQTHYSSDIDSSICQLERHNKTLRLSIQRINKMGRQFQELESHQIIKIQDSSDNLIKNMLSLLESINDHSLMDSQEQRDLLFAVFSQYQCIDIQ